MNPVVAIDMSVLAYKSYYKLKHLTTSKGKPSGMFFGILRSFFKILEKIPGADLKLFWDSPSVWRKKIYPEYKANRGKSYDKESLYFQLFSEIIQDLEAFPFPSFRDHGQEADDLLASYILRNPNQQVYIYSTDSDFYQFLSPQVSFIDFSGKDWKIYDYLSFEDEFGFSPKFYPLYKSIKGDKSDNISGVLRYPTDSLIEVLNLVEFNSPDEFISKLGSKKKLSKVEKSLLEEDSVKDIFKRNFSLISLSDKAISEDFRELVPKDSNFDKILEIFKKYEFNSLINQQDKLKKLLFPEPSGLKIGG